MIEQRLQQVAKLCASLAKGQFRLAKDPETQAFCCAYLTELSYNALLTKVEHELGKSCWRPLGRVLIVVSEKDVIGSLLAVLAAFITGNQILVKARHSQPLLYWCKAQLQLTDEQLSILDWQSEDTVNEPDLASFNALLLAGSLALMQYYRHRLSYPARLIEYGPKISAAVLMQINSQIIQQLMQVVSVFSQQVCSSPQFIVVDEAISLDELLAALTPELVKRHPLAAESKLVQASHYQQLQLLQRCDARLISSAFSPETGWGISVSRGLAPDLWFKQGLNICLGPATTLLDQAAQRWGDSLQTLGVVGNLNWQPSAFFRLCPLAQMHHRPLTAAHDGFFELAALVNFYQDERL